MRIDRDDPGFDRVATLDIETTHYDAAKWELVSIGLGVHERGDPGAAAQYDLFHRDGTGEAALVRRAMDRLCALDADGLVSYNGREFDLPFIADHSNCSTLGRSSPPSRITTSTTSPIESDGLIGRG